MIEHKETCLKINGKTNCKKKIGSIKFKNNFKQIAVPFMIYADFESILKWVRSSVINTVSYIKKYLILLAVLLITLCVFMINLASQLLFTEEKLQFIDSLKLFLKSMIKNAKKLSKMF